MDYVKHPLIRPNTIEQRLYQASILNESLKSNMLVVLPTGLGKTPVAVLLAAHRLEKYPGSKVLVMAPTRPLVSQHHKSFMKFINLPEDEFAVVNGLVNPDARSMIYREKRLVFATPQTINHDIESRRIDLKQFSLLVTDEAHHSIGGYSYPFVAKKYLGEAENPRLLGLTQAPGARARRYGRYAATWA